MLKRTAMTPTAAAHTADHHASAVSYNVELFFCIQLTRQLLTISILSLSITSNVNTVGQNFTWGPHALIIIPYTESLWTTLTALFQKCADIYRIHAVHHEFPWSHTNRCIFYPQSKWGHSRVLLKSPSIDNLCRNRTIAAATLRTREIL